MRRTREALIAGARTLTAEHGLAGFTVEELCESVGVSRRTFFNYFATKEDAVVGDPPDFLPESRRADFVARGAGEHEGLSPTLLHDMVALIVDDRRTHEFSRRDHLLFRDIVRSEPHLLARLIAANESQQRSLAHAIAEREGLPADHPLPRVIVGIVLGLTFHTAEDLFAADSDDVSFEELLLRNVGYAQQFLTQNLDALDPTGRS